MVGTVLDRGDPVEKTLHDAVVSGTTQALSTNSSPITWDSESITVTPTIPAGATYEVRVKPYGVSAGNPALQAAPDVDAEAVVTKSGSSTDAVTVALQGFATGEAGTDRLADRDRMNMVEINVIAANGYDDSDMRDPADNLIATYAFVAARTAPVGYLLENTDITFEAATGSPLDGANPVQDGNRADDRFSVAASGSTLTFSVQLMDRDRQSLAVRVGSRLYQPGARKTRDDANAVRYTVDLNAGRATVVDLDMTSEDNKTKSYQLVVRSEAVVALSLTRNTIGETEMVDLTASLSGPATSVVSVSVRMSDPAGVVGDVTGAADDGDLSSGSADLEFLVGETEKVVSLEAPDNDIIADGDATVTFSGRVTDGGLADPSSVALTVEDNDVAAFVVVAPAAPVPEGASETVTITLAGGTFASNQQIALAAAGGTATSGDYNFPSGLVFLAGTSSTSASFSVNASADGIYEGGAGGTAETVGIAISHKGERIGTGTADVTVSITDGTDAPTFALTPAAGVTIDEGDTETLTMTISNGVELGIAMTVTLAVTGGQTTDYTLSKASIELAEGATSGSATFTAVDDTEPEPNNETFTVTPTVTVPAAGITGFTPPTWTIVISPSDN